MHNAFEDKSFIKQFGSNMKAVMLGHAIGDALGVPAEFRSREELDVDPITDMVGYGTYPYPEGCWSDDTSMSLATLDSLRKGKINTDYIMINFGKWYYQNEYTPTGEMFDVGYTCSCAIDNYFAHRKPISECGLADEMSNGNGSLMRIHPIVLMAHITAPIHSNWKVEVERVSAITHAHERTLLACKIYSLILFHLFISANKEQIREALKTAKELFASSAEFKHFERLLSPDFEQTPRSEIKSTGYVVDTLEAAVWCLLTTDSYSECVLKAVNLGGDTDTVAAVAGGLAGALHGYSSLPRKWLNKLKRRDYIEKMCEDVLNDWRNLNIR